LDSRWKKEKRKTTEELDGDRKEQLDMSGDITGEGGGAGTG